MIFYIGNQKAEIMLAYDEEGYANRAMRRTLGPILNVPDFFAEVFQKTVIVIDRSGKPQPDTS